MPFEHGTILQFLFEQRGLSFRTVRWIKSCPWTVRCMYVCICRCKEGTFAHVYQLTIITKTKSSSSLQKYKISLRLRTWLCLVGHKFFFLGLTLTWFRVWVRVGRVGSVWGYVLHARTRNSSFGPKTRDCGKPQHAANLTTKWALRKTLGHIGFLPVKHQNIFMSRVTGSDISFGNMHCRYCSGLSPVLSLFLNSQMAISTRQKWSKICPGYNYYVSWSETLVWEPVLGS